MPGKCSLIVLAAILSAALVMSAGCTAGVPGNPTGPAIPTNEPTAIPTIPPVATPPAQPYATPVPVYTVPPTPYVTPYTTPYYPGNTPGYVPYRPQVYPGYMPGYSNQVPGYGGSLPGYAPVYQSPGYPPPVTINPAYANPAELAFLSYSDQNFGIQYPSDWNVGRTSYVQFSSPDGRIAFTAEVNNFLPGLAGVYRLNPDISSVQTSVSHEFPRYSAQNIIYNYQTSQIKSIPVTIYSVRLPDGSVSYTRYVMVTLQHVYQFTFSADTATFDQVAALRNYMFNSLTIADTA